MSFSSFNVSCELVNHYLIPHSAVVTENGRILQISVQHQHCENGLQSFGDSYLQHKHQKKYALNARFKVTPIVNRGYFK